MKRAGSGLSLSHPEQAESFPVLFEICGRVVVDFVLLQKGVHLHSRFETEQPTKLGGSERVRPVCFKCQAFKRGARQVLPFAFQPVCDVFRQFQLNPLRRTPFNPLSQDALLRPRSMPEAPRWTFNHQIVSLQRNLPPRQRRLAAPAAPSEANGSHVRRPFGAPGRPCRRTE